jgi:uncharacterized protein
MRRVLADSGFLVALGIERDPRHGAALEFLDVYAGALLVPSPVVVETCFFLSEPGKVRLLDWLGKPPRKVLELPASAYPELRETLAKYADLDPDFTDAAIVWLAEKTGCRAILTTDLRDFGAFRLRKSRRFELIEWFAR